MAVDNFIPELADAVAAAINAAQAAEAFSVPFGGAERVYLPEFKVEDSERQGVIVCVMAKETEGEVLTRGRLDSDEVGVDVGIWARVPDHKPETIDPLLNLIRQLWSTLRAPLTTASGQGCTFRKRVCNPLYDQLLLKQHQFLSVTTFTYNVTHTP